MDPAEVKAQAVRGLEEEYDIGDSEEFDDADYVHFQLQTRPVYVCPLSSLLFLRSGLRSIHSRLESLVLLFCPYSDSL